jgi:hypothetical protein
MGPRPAKTRLNFVPQVQRHDGKRVFYSHAPLVLGAHAPLALAGGQTNPLALVPDEASNVPLGVKELADRGR